MNNKFLPLWIAGGLLVAAYFLNRYRVTVQVAPQPTDSNAGAANYNQTGGASYAAQPANGGAVSGADNKPLFGAAW